MILIVISFASLVIDIFAGRFNNGRRLLFNNQRGFLENNKKDKKNEGGSKVIDDVKAATEYGLAAKIKNIDDKFVGRKAVRCVSFDTNSADVGPANDTLVAGPDNTYVPNAADANSAQQNKGSVSEEAGSLKGDNVRVDHYDDIVTPCAHTELGHEHEVSRNIKGCGDTTRKGAAAGSSAEKVESSDCVRPKDAANLVKYRYENSIVGSCVGKDPSFPVVQNYGSNTWSKFGFEKISRNDNGVYLFKFSTNSGMEQVLERGLLMIRKSPIILNTWSSSVSLKKKASLIATQIGKPIMLDAFTSSMCVESWGRISFARALIEISSESTLKKEVTMAIPNDEDDGHTKEVIRVEYEWKPPHCVECKTFGHGPNLCPKRVREDIPKASSMAAKSSNMEENEEGFVEQKKRVGSKEGSITTSPSGSTNDNDKGDGGKSSPSCAKPALNTSVSNPFEVLNVVGEDAYDSSVQQLNGSDHVGNSSSNLDKKEAQEEGLWSHFKNAKENSKSKVTELEDESDEDKVYMPYGGGGMDGLEDDLDCNDGYGT
ncbi:retrovirus-related pol polyprotein from transposon TNT 1-94 [Tanacetum coccineum]